MSSVAPFWNGGLDENKGSIALSNHIHRQARRDRETLEAHHSPNVISMANPDAHEKKAKYKKSCGRLHSDEVH